MSAYGKPTDINIAAMKKQEAGSYNVMLPGSGTPWEDRGRVGLVAAFFKTCFKSLFGHRALLDQIRRPETTSEARGFAIGGAAIWALSIAIWDAFLYYRYSHDPAWVVVSGQQYLLETALCVVGTFLLVLIFLSLAATLFVSLLGHTAQQQVPKVLVYNVLGYSVGPSILAIVPVVGWALAAVWIMIDMMIGAKTRLYLRTREVVVDVLIISAVIVVLIAAIYFACYFLWPMIAGGGSIVPYVPPKPTMMN